MGAWSIFEEIVGFDFQGFRDSSEIINSDTNMPGFYFA